MFSGFVCMFFLIMLYEMITIFVWSLDCKGLVVFLKHTKFGRNFVRRGKGEEKVVSG